MALMTSSASGSSGASKSAQKVGFWEGQRLAKQKAYERQAKRKKIKLEMLCYFTQQLSAMLEAGLPLVTALDALQDQTEDPVFQIIIRDVRGDVSGGTSLSEACAKFPNAFPNLFVAMVEAGEASGGLAQLLGKVGIYFEESVKLTKQVKGAMTYPVVVICIAIILVYVLLVFVIPVFGDMFNSMGAKLPAPTQFLIDLSYFLGHYWWGILLALIAVFKSWTSFIKTPKGRVFKDNLVFKLPVVGQLVQKIGISRFCRTYAVLIRSGVPVLRSLEIVSRASNNTFIESACREFARQIGQGGQMSDALADTPYFPPIVKHMARAGEQTGNMDGMLTKVSDFYDAEIETLIEALTSLMEPLLIVFLGVVIGGIVMAMFMPIFMLANVAGG